MSRVLITGDTHRDVDNKKLKSIQESVTLDRNDYLIIAGDSGILFDQNKEGLDKQEQLIEYYDNFPCNVLIVDGNHDNHDLLHKLPKEGYGGGVVGRISDNIRHLKRGYVYEIGFHKFFIFGGARSTDQTTRVIGVDWWPGEAPTRKQTERAFDNLQAVNWQVKYVVTHTGPRTILNYMGKAVTRDVYKDSTAVFLEQIYEKLNYKHWYFGHIHIDQTINGNISCLFNRVKEVEIL